MVYELDALQQILKIGMQGYYSPNEYKICLDMTEEQYQGTLNSFKNKRLVSEKTKTIFHEYGHWLQAVTTPYGLYMEWLTKYSTLWLLRLEAEMVKKCEGHTDARLPFFYLIKMFPDLLSEPSVLEPLYNWLEFSVVKCYLQADYFEYSEYLENYRALRADVMEFHFISKYIRNVDKTMASLFMNDSGSQFYYHPYRNFLYHKEEKNRIWERELEMAKWKTVTGVSSRSLYESFSTVLEWCLTPNDFTIPDTISYDMADYFFPLVLLRMALPKCSKGQFLYSCLCVFDIVFAVPALPQYYEMRDSRPDCQKRCASLTFQISDFDLPTRFHMILGQLSQTGPIRDGELIEAYEHKLCRLLNWATPLEMAQTTVKNSKLFLQNEDMLSFIFLKYQEMRVKGYSPFFDHEVFLNLLAKDTVQVPVLELEDTFLIDHEISNEANFTMDYLVRQFVIQVMTMDRIELQMPFQVEDSSIKIYKRMLCDYLKKIGIDIVPSAIHIKPAR